MSIGWMLAVFALLMAMGVPIGFCLALSAILKILLDGQLPMLILMITLTVAGLWSLSEGMASV